MTLTTHPCPYTPRPAGERCPRTLIGVSIPVVTEAMWVAHLFTQAGAG